MAYELIIAEHADALLDKLVYYLLFQLKNEQAAKHFLDSLEHIYARLEDNPLQFPRCHNAYLANKGYYEAILPDMNYMVIFDIDDCRVYVLGIFHQSESYFHKL